MKKKNPGIPLKELAGQLGAEYQGQDGLMLTHSCGLDSLQPGGLAYVTGRGVLGNVPVPAELDRSLKNAPEQEIGEGIALIVPKDYESKKETSSSPRIPSVCMSRRHACCILS